MRRWFVRGALAGIACFVLLALGFFVGVPWLARRGALDGLIERLASSNVPLDVRLDTFETRPLDHVRFHAPRIDGAAASGERGSPLAFAAEEVLVEYSALGLFARRLESVTIREPRLTIRIDRDLATLFASFASKPPAGDAAPGRPPPADAYLPFTCGRVRIVDGTVLVQHGERSLELRGVRAELEELGRRHGQTLSVDAELWGGTIHLEGKVDRPVDAPDGRWRLRSLVLRARDLSPLELLAALTPAARRETTFHRWLRDEAASAAIELRAVLAGTYPDALELTVSATARVPAGTSDGAPHTSPSAATDATRGSGDGFTLRAGARFLARAALEEITGRFTLEGNGPLRGVVAGDSVHAQLSAAGAATATLSSGAFTAEVTSCALRVDDVGELTGSVSVRAPGETSDGRGPGIGPGTGPGLELDVTLAGVDLARIARRWAGDRSSPGERDLTPSGVATLEVKASGTLDAPRADVALRVVDGGFDVDGESYTLGTFTSDAEGLRVEPGGRAAIERLRFAAPTLDLAHLAALAFAPGVELEGRGGIEGEVEGLTFPPPREAGGDQRARLRLLLRDLGLRSETSEIVEAAAEVDIELAVDAAERRGRFRLRGRGEASEFLVGPFYGVLGVDALSIGGEGEFSWTREGRVDAVTFEALELSTPYTGAVEGRGQLSFAAPSPALDVRLTASAVPSRTAFDFFAREPFAEAVPMLAGGHLDGSVQIALDVRGALGAPSFDGVLRVEGGELQLDGLAAQGVDIDLPVRINDRDEHGPWEPRAARVTVDRLALGPAAGSDRDAGPRVVVTSIDLPLELRHGGTYRLTRAVRWPTAGGFVEIDAAALQPSGPLRVDADIRAEDLSLRELVQYRVLRDFPATLSFDLSPLRIRGDAVTAGGSLSLEVFGGEVELRDLRMRNLSKPYRSLRLEQGRLRRLSLGKIGEAFDFGLVSGELAGEIHGLQFVAGEVTAFEMEVATAKRAGVPQYIDRRAIESLRTILSGPIGSVERTLFSRFRYAAFGFAATLSGNALRLRGVRREDDVEYLMYSAWYQLPKIFIINKWPDKEYDWRSIVQRLQGAYERGPEMR